MNDELVQAAKQARQLAYAPYSLFKVGAALLTRDGAIITGCNIENSSYGLTNCAERTALFKALSDGHTRFKQLCVVADTSDPPSPCGGCRQVIWELCGDIPILLVNLRGISKATSSSELLPHPFERTHLPGEQSGQS